ncbi:hypothetical protein BAJUN_00090 [Bajunvirus bajun]|uniref:Uncharacterized protein n=1 Tax=Brevundimonas phage vB_BgoS-Bajun TaxID=2948594 RepID=A0A9E7N770_9CAUD|nr:hypothetical protein BAJUN_00090 [Brevundimonas phage vB_BgoS-Bajun]
MVEIAQDPAANLGRAMEMIKPAEEQVQEWIAYLRSGKVKLGVGLLRDGDDTYDPAGALANLNMAEWEWDDDEGAYKVADGGDCMFPPAKLVGKWLGCGTSASEARLEAFTAALAEAADGALNMADLARLIERCDSEWRSREREYKRDLQEAHSRGGYRERMIGERQYYDSLDAVRPLREIMLGRRGI